MNLHLPLRITPLLALLFSACSEPTEEENQDLVGNAVSVETIVAERGSVQSWTFTQGTARAVRREYLTFEDPGKVTFVKDGLREGSEVKAGELLVSQDQRRLKAEIETARASVVEASTQASVAESQREEARTDEELAKTTFERFSTLLKQNSASKQEFDEARAQADKATAAVARAENQILAAEAQVAAAEARLRQAEIELEQTEMRAPIDGIVGRLNVQEGYYMTPNLVRTDTEEAFMQTVPLLLLDNASFEITVDLPPSEESEIVEGKEAYIQAGGATPLAESGAASFDPATFPIKGEVYSVAPAVTPGKRAVQIKVRTNEGSDLLQDGAFATVWIKADQHDDVVTVPMGVFVYRDNQPYVFVVDPETNKAQLRQVVPGLSGLDTLEIVSGINAGERIVTNGRYQLSDGAPVTLVGGDSDPTPAEGGDQ